jgi:hypothetical protein
MEETLSLTNRIPQRAWTARIEGALRLARETDILPTAQSATSSMP